jgi:hypothetical protein
LARATWARRTRAAGRVGIEHEGHAVGGEPARAVGDEQAERMLADQPLQELGTVLDEVRGLVHRCLGRKPDSCAPRVRPRPAPAVSDDEAIVAPPRQTSPSYSTADCPASPPIAAHRSERERAVAPARQRAGRVGLAVARLGARSGRGGAAAGDPAGVVGDERVDSSQGWSWPWTT